MTRRASARPPQPRPGATRRAPSALAAVLLVALTSVPATIGAAPARAADCDHTDVPYAGIPGADLSPTDHESLDSPPVRYTRWRGFVPGFDGMPFSVDVTVPCDGGADARPLVVMAHGFTDDKTVWQETGKSDRVTSEDRPQTNSQWNNIWFASKGYAVLNYTARGWRDSCGPDAPGASPATPAPQCAPFEYWIHLDDKRWEVRDAQWLTGGLVQSGVADRGRLAMTGGSYGGAPTAMAALLGGRTMCGGAVTPAELGPDPCEGSANGDLVPWTTPDGTTDLTWAAAVPLYTFADLIQVLAPNGRGSDGEAGAPPDGDHTDPFGVPIESTVAGLLVAGNAAGFFAPPGVDPDADIVTDAGRLLAGNPFPQEDPLVQRGVELYRTFKSPITTDPVERVPMFWVQGFTDPLFTGLEALQVRRRLRDADPGYPIKVFLGDIGHDYTGQRQDEWDLVRRQMNDFLDHHLARGPGRPAAPSYDVGATVTRCLDHDAPMRYEAAPEWADLHPEEITFESTEPGTTNSATVGPAGLATDPISTATLPLPGSYKGCRKMAPSQPDPTTATYLFEAPDDLVLMGGPVVDLTYTTTGPDTELNVRLWDVAADGSVQGLVTRGTYRSLDGPGQHLQARYQIAPNGYRFPAGHTVKLEVTANDAPYLQASRVPAVVTVERVALTLPLLERTAGVTPPAPTAAPAPAAAPGGTLPATGGGAWPVAAAGALLMALLAGTAVRLARRPR